MRFRILLLALIVTLSLLPVIGGNAWIILDEDTLQVNDFLYDFSQRGENAFETDWHVIDGNGDGLSWQYSPWIAGVDGTDGVAVCYGNYETYPHNNDYLVMIETVRLTEGENHLSFYARAGYGEEEESIEVLYAETCDIENMHLIGSVSLLGSQWTAHIFNFDVPREGQYHLVFRSCGIEGVMACIDNVSVGNGNLPPFPNLKITRLLLPVSNCDLSDECRIGALIHNLGTKDSEYFTLKCDINNGQQVFEELLSETIAPNETKAVYFTRTADLADIGEYSVKVYGNCEGRTMGEQTETVSSLLPVTLPLCTDFSDKSLGEWIELEPGSWTYDDYGCYWQGESGGLVHALLSRCFEAGKAVRVKVAYGCSEWGEGNMHIAVGKAGSDPKFFHTVYQDSVFSGTKDIEFEFKVPEPDRYCLMIVNDCVDERNESLWLKSITISDVRDFDVAITDVKGCISPFTPIDQLTATTPLTITMSNRGLMDFDGLRLSVILDGTIVGTTVFDRPLKIGETVDIDVSVDISRVCVDNLLHLSVMADGKDTDEFMADNTFSINPMWVTQSLRANERMSDFDLGIGTWGEPLSVGNVYRLACDDVLTALEICLTPTENLMIQETEIKVSIYKLDNENTLGRCLFELTTKRGSGGAMTIPLDPMLLGKGGYYIEVAQLSSYNMGLAYEYSEGNTCYQNDGTQIRRIDNGLGLAIRAIFEDVFAPSHDVSVQSIVSPAKAVGLYAKDQTITANIKNKGYYEADFSAFCLVEGEKVSEIRGSLLPYEERIYEFGSYDMSSLGNYTIEIVTSMGDDENLSNDRFSARYVAVEEQNPYVMDFEYCDDFDGQDEVLNPRWRTVDRLGLGTDGFWQYSYPHHSKSCGFIAFNPEMTVPSMTSNGFEGFYPNSGKRFGAAFAAAIDPDNPVEHSDVWLISPKLQLHTGSNLELYVKTRALESESQSLEPYQILLSETDDNFGSFIILGNQHRTASAANWERVTEDLSQFDGKAVHVAIRYLGRPGENVVLMVDDISVLTGQNGVATPGLEDIKISCDGDMIRVSAETEIENITIHDIYRREVLSASPKERCLEISTHRLSSGIYVASVTTPYSHKTMKFIMPFCRKRCVSSCQ